MNLYTCSVMLAGDRNHVVAGKGPVTVPEIAVLKAIHGDTSITDIRLYQHPADAEPLPDLSQSELREHLRLRYQNALPAGNDPVVDKLFPGLSLLPTTLAEIGIDARAEAARLRAQAAEAEAAARQLDEQEPEGSDAERAELEAFLGTDAPAPTRNRKAA